MGRPIPVYAYVNRKRVRAGTVFPPLSKGGDWECEEYIDGMSWGCETKEEAIRLCRKEFLQRVPELKARYFEALKKAEQFNIF